MAMAHQSSSDSENPGSASATLSQTGVTGYEAFDLRGTQVTNALGQGLGRISDFVIDPQGRIMLVVLYRGGIRRL